jgi:hypothetical protein
LAGGRPAESDVTEEVGSHARSAWTKPRRGNPKLNGDLDDLIARKQLKLAIDLEDVASKLQHPPALTLELRQQMKSRVRSVVDPT